MFGCVRRATARVVNASLCLCAQHCARTGRSVARPRPPVTTGTFPGIRKMLVGLALVTVTGCSVHPIPDDVSPLKTEDIVRYARCELKRGVAERINEALVEVALSDINPEDVLERKAFERICAKNTRLANKLQAYGASAIAYDFEFNIFEKNQVESTIGLKLPLLFVPAVPNSGLDLTASGKLHKARDAKRSFRSAENFRDLRYLDCKGFGARDKNLLYPITGQIGLDKVVKTFIALSEAGGIKNLGEGKDQFLDDITFTTTINGTIEPKLTLNAVPNSFRLVSASGKKFDERMDQHKVKVSLTFPKLEKDQTKQKSGKKRDSQALPLTCENGKVIDARSVQQAEDDALRRSQLNLCISTGLAREDEFQMLRFYPPDVYCRLSDWLPTAMAPGPGRPPR